MAAGLQAISTLELLSSSAAAAAEHASRAEQLEELERLLRDDLSNDLSDEAIARIADGPSARLGACVLLLRAEAAELGRGSRRDSRQATRPESPPSATAAVWPAATWQPPAQMPERTDEAEFVETVGHASPSGGALLRYERPPPTPTYGREPRDQQRPTLSVCCGRGAWHAGEANGIVSFSFKILHSKLGDGGRMRLGIVAQGERGSMDYALWFCPYSGIFSEAGHCLAAERDTGKQGEPVMQGSLARGKAATAAQVDVQADTLRNELRFSVVEADGYRHPWNVAVIRKKPVPLPAIFAPVARLGRPGDAVELSRVQVYLPGAVLREQLCQPALGVLGGEMERALGLPDPSIATSELAAARAKLAEARDVQSQAERGSGCHFVWLDAEALRKSRDTMPRLLPKQVRCSTRASGRALRLLFSLCHPPPPPLIHASSRVQLFCFSGAAAAPSGVAAH